MQASMQDFPLTTQHLLWRLERLFWRKEVVTRGETGVRRQTYGELVVRVNRLASALGRLGVKPGDRVATLAFNNNRHLELYYAVPSMGAILHTLNLRLPPDQLAYVVADAGDSVLCVDRALLPLVEKLAGALPSVRHVVVLSDGGPVPDGTHDYETLLAAESGSFAWPALDERSAAGICHTSGTTGMPKGVVYSHRSNLLHTMCLLQSVGLSLAEGDVVLPVVPMFHANAWGLPLAAAMSGATLVLPDRFMADGPTLVSLAVSERATILAGVPTIWIGLLAELERTGVRLPDVRAVFCGGSALPRSLMEGMDRLGLRMLHAWGMTETSPLATIAYPRSWHEGDPLAVRLSQGTAVPLVELRIADLATGSELPWDGVAFGEVQVRGPWVASGYLNDADPGRMTPDGWFRTGDVATVDADGFMRIVDRTKDVIKSGGEWISSVTLENTIMSHPKVLEAAVVALPHVKWQERPVAYVVPRPVFRDGFDSDEVLAFLRERVPGFWLPDEIRVIAEIPKTSVGKFDKKLLRATAEPLPA